MVDVNWMLKCQFMKIYESFMKYWIFDHWFIVFTIIIILFDFGISCIEFYSSSNGIDWYYFTNASHIAKKVDYRVVSGNS